MAARLHTEILDRRQRLVLARMGPLLSERGFYLAGGTALALHLGHRRSVDLDWFSEAPLEDPLGLAGELRREPGGFRTRDVARGTLHGSAGGVRVSVLEYRYPLLEPARFRPEAKCRLASLDDIAAMKLAAVAQRGSRKDFIDVYALGVRHRPLGEMLSLYERRFGVRDVGHILYGLVWFEDADHERPPRLLVPASWRTVKRTIRTWVEAAAR